MDAKVKAALSEWRESQGRNPVIKVCRPLGGGSINRVYLTIFSDEQHSVIKTNLGKPKEFFQVEWDGLEELAKSDTIRVPKVHDLLKADEDHYILILEYIESAKKCLDYDEKLGRGLATLHSNAKALKFGFHSDNLLGETLQQNDWKENWADFWIQNRMEPQIRMATDNGYFSSSDQKFAARFISNIQTIIDHPCEPSLIHGDLWSGNIMSDQKGEPVIIDPAVYFADPEAEFGMIRLFGSQEKSFYEAYQEIKPFDDGYEERFEIYKFYHVINHLNLFGRGYLSSCKEIMNRFAR